ncbi:MAG: geranylgeranylglyceryl/heptaprenylglyceryl phosphate synthase [Candidatus Marinimicrobia bacterium]|nr:geranylgeranylglyceryl/heptaprenylglyceryl phosphate synthase [Candidatus Neomarinimicrobiota bacterium]
MIFDTLITTIEKKGAVYIVLIDPDKEDDNSIINRVKNANNSGVDALFVGGSIMMDINYNSIVKKIKSLSNIPVILFPGGVGQLNKHFDAMLFMSLISGRNPRFLIEEQVLAAPIVDNMNIETISTGYILVNGGSNSSVEFMSSTKPIPMERVEITVAHALAGQYLGMKLIYLEAGSGAIHPVTTEVIKAVRDAIDLPIIVGGGIKTPEKARDAVEAGASIIVTGNILEEDDNCVQEFADAIHIQK